MLLQKASNPKLITFQFEVWRLFLKKKKKKRNLIKPWIDENISTMKKRLRMKEQSSTEHEDVTLNVESGFGFFGTALIVISYIMIMCTVPFSLFASFKVIFSILFVRFVSLEFTLSLFVTDC